jgi:hypothetical protein
MRSIRGTTAPLRPLRRPRATLLLLVTLPSMTALLLCGPVAVHCQQNGSPHYAGNLGRRDLLSATKVTPRPTTRTTAAEDDDDDIVHILTDTPIQRRDRHDMRTIQQIHTLLHGSEGGGGGFSQDAGTGTIGKSSVRERRFASFRQGAFCAGFVGQLRLL